LGAGGTGSNQSGQTFFDASRSNPIYGNSDTVQPRAMAVSWCIQVYNTASPLSTQDSSYLASQMQAKAQLDLANVVSSVDFVVESWSDDNGNWYRKYRSGWIEQGGLADSPSNLAEVTLLNEMADTNYHVIAGMNMGSGTTMSSSPATATPYTTTLIKVGAHSGGNYKKRIAWQVKGYAK
jgi:hypothetical protein